MCSSYRNPLIAFVQSVESLDSSEGDSTEEIMKGVTQVLKELHKEFVTNIQKEVKEPIIKEIKQVTVLVVSAVSGSDDVV